MDGMVNLRVILALLGLLLIGVVFVVSLAASRRKSHSKQARKLRRGGARPRPPERLTEEPLTSDHPDEGAFAQLDRLVKNDASVSDVPVMHRDPDVDLNRGQMELLFDDRRDKSISTDSPKVPSEILVINIKRVDGAMRGNDLVNILTDAGMKFGDMGIFHHYGLSERPSAQPVFSLANLYEPGTFDIQRMDMFSTRGVAMFLQLPSAGIDNEVACELFVNTADRIAHTLSCRLFNQSHQELTAQDLEAMRRRARLLERGVAG